MPTLLGWLVDFDRTLTRQILLVVDEAIWDILTRDSKEFQSVLKKIEIIRAPTAKSKELPLNAGLAKMFKEVYYRRLLEVLRSHAEASNPKVDIELDSLDDYLLLIRDAWEQISDRFIGSCFTPFLSVPQQGQVSMASRLDDATSVALCSELKRAFPRAPDSAFQYYKNLEKGTGPSGFVREKIMSMQDHEDFFECFGAPSFGSVRIARLYSTSRFIRPLQTHSQGSVLVPLPTHDSNPLTHPHDIQLRSPSSPSSPLSRMCLEYESHSSRSGATSTSNPSPTLCLQYPHNPQQMSRQTPSRTVDIVSSPKSKAMSVIGSYIHVPLRRSSRSMSCTATMPFGESRPGSTCAQSSHRPSLPYDPSPPHRSSPLHPSSTPHRPSPPHRLNQPTPQFSILSSVVRRFRGSLAVAPERPSKPSEHSQRKSWLRRLALKPSLYLARMKRRE